MTTETQHPLDDDDAFEQELAKLYRAALLDEQFQQQVQQDLQTLPASAQAELQPAEQVFVQEEKLSAAAKARMLEMIPPCRQQQSVIAKPLPWWRKLLTANWGKFPVAGAGIQHSGRVDGGGTVWCVAANPAIRPQPAGVCDPWW